MVDLCHGCGIDVSKKTHDRRLLSTAKSQHVLISWKSFLDSLDIDLGDLPVGYMCRTCFFSYERYITLKRNIEDKLDIALDKVNISSGGMSKRMRLDSSGRPPVLSQNPSSTCSASPDVRVYTL